MRLRGAVTFDSLELKVPSDEPVIWAKLSIDPNNQEPHVWFGSHMDRRQ